LPCPILGKKVPSYTWRVSVSEDVLGFCALVLTMLMSLGIVVWFSLCIMNSILKMKQRHKRLRYTTLLRENERLKSFLADVEEENLRLRKVYHTEIIRRKSKGIVSRKVA
jgi:hypothetical protein